MFGPILRLSKVNDLFGVDLFGAMRQADTETELEPEANTETEKQTECVARKLMRSTSPSVEV